MDDKRKEQIREESKQILDNFSKSLNRVKVGSSTPKEKAGGFREEDKECECDLDFRERMFENAPNKEGDYIVAEVGKW